MRHATTVLTFVRQNISWSYLHKLIKEITSINPQFSRVDAPFVLLVRNANPQS